MKLFLTILMIWIAPALLLGSYLAWVIVRSRNDSYEQPEHQFGSETVEDPSSVAAE